MRRCLQRSLRPGGLLTDRWARAVVQARYGTAWWGLWFAFPARGLATFERLYAYFRWADDRVDVPHRDRVALARFVARQRAVAAGAVGSDTIEEAALQAALAGPDGARLLPAVVGMLDALAFDASRDPSPIPAAALAQQADRIGGAFVTAVWVCAGEPGAPPPAALDLARGACFVHVLRDREVDRGLGYENRPPGPDGAPIADARWVADVSTEAERCFARGAAALTTPMRPRTRWLLLRYAARYRDQLPSLRTPTPG